MNTTHKKLHVVVLTPEQHKRTCNYWFTVLDNSTSHTAFTHLSGLLTWLAERGLKLSQPITAPGIWSVQDIVGSYSEQTHNNEDTFNALAPIIETREMSNGDYTLGKITESEDGHRTVHTLNPNVKTRPVFDYRESQEIYG